MTADLVEWASSGLLAASFPHSRAAGYLPALNVARQAQHYGELQIGKQTLHLAGFGRSRQQAALALIVVRYLRSGKGVQLYAGGSLIVEWSRAEAVLHCYLESCATPDHRAHCHVVASARQVYGHNGIQAQGWRPSEAMPAGLEWLSQIDDKAMPCRFMLRWGFRLHPALPVSEAEQIHAGAVRAHCDWCPNFNPGGDPCTDHSSPRLQHS